MTEDSEVSSMMYLVEKNNQDQPWRDLLAQTWAALAQLPPLQKTVILLSLSDSELSWFLISGTASIRQIGRVLQLAPEQYNRLWVMLEWNEEQRASVRTLTTYDEKFALLWQKLPLNDLTIAALLVTTQENIVRLRQAGRQRLLRKMGKPRFGLSSDLNL